MKSIFYCCGKLLISGEYLILNGAKAFALPTKYGQTLEVESKNGSGKILWVAYKSDKSIWLETSFILTDNNLLKSTNRLAADDTKIILLKKILENAIRLNPIFLNNNTDYLITTTLQFPIDWGLGSSSTIICNVANWFKINPFLLFFDSLKGSAYDIAVAIEQKPLIYQLDAGKPKIETIKFLPPFANEIFFVHLNKKQKSDNEILKFEQNKYWDNKTLNKISEITLQMTKCKKLEEFENLIAKHENIMSKVLRTKAIKEQLFNDYQGAIKSLGAWGGDFVLATRKNALNYFPSKGYNTVKSWNDMIISY